MGGYRYMDFELKQQEEMEIIQKRVNVLRNTNLFVTDIKDDFLTKSFFERKDISKNKKEILKQLEDELKRYKKQSDKDFQ
jgi:hypothetical protein